MPFVRGFADIRQWDGLACEAASTAQLLYMTGKLSDQFNRKEFDRAIGRAPGQFGLAGGCINLLLREGFTIRVIEPTSFADAQNRASTRKRLQQAGYAPEQIKAYMVDFFPLQVQRALAAQQVVGRYPTRCILDTRQPTRQDVASALEMGRVVCTTLLNSVGTMHDNLLYRSGGKVHVYDPDSGISVNAQIPQLQLYGGAVSIYDHR